MKQKLITSNWKCRCSNLGKIMTNLPIDDPKEIDKLKSEIEALESERDNGINANGNKVKWTTTKEETLQKLYVKAKILREGETELPTGAKTFLLEEFRRIFWNRRRFLNNKYLEKGTIQETEGLDLVGWHDGEEYFKNEEYLENEYLTGTPDNLQGKLKDTKLNWDLESFDNAELCTLYNYQLKGYMFLLKDLDIPELETKTEAEVCYCLVNNPLSQIESTIKSAYFNSGLEEDSEEYIEIVKQIERNMIFDKEAFKESNPNYIFTDKTDFSIPASYRVKRFSVTYDKRDEEHIKRRVLLSRKFLMEREIEVLKKLGQYEESEA